jgi:glycosyltransferase involved in cell wall biosynthesis
MKIRLYSSLTFEPWDWTNAERVGIGGSETHQIQVARRLAARGHDVVSYAPVPWTGEREHQGVRWRNFLTADFTEPAAWIIARDPIALESFPDDRDGFTVLFLAQDSYYDTWRAGVHSQLVDRYLALCPAHLAACRVRDPSLAGALVLSANGIDVEAMAAQEAVEGWPARDPAKLVYASSPDRGLASLLGMFPRIRERVPAASLEVYYGFDNVDKIAGPRRICAQREKARVLGLLDQPGVTWLGRAPQPDLWRAWRSAGLWCHPTNFAETSCITSMEAQALGAIPITRPVWALAHNVRHGWLIDGNAEEDALVQARYVDAIAQLATDTALQLRIRQAMQPAARARFGWEHVVDQLEALCAGAPAQVARC